MAQQQVLVVDDEEDIQELVRYNLTRNGFGVTVVATGEAALEAARAGVPDVILLDLMLPGIDGLEVCTMLRHDPKTARIPIIMLTARGEEADVVAGLELGADDYIAKPFSPRVLAARVKAVLRRKLETEEEDRAVIKRGELVIHPGRREVLVGGRSIELTSTEFLILHRLARRPGWVFTRHQIIEAARGDDYPVTDRSVDVHIVGLRRKLGACAGLIETVRGVGYRFKER